MLLNDLNEAKYEETLETFFKGKVGGGTKCLKKQLCDVIKIHCPATNFLLIAFYY